MKISPKGLSLNIDPELFKRYNIQRVPTFVLVRNEKEVRRLSGNVPLEFASKKLNELRVKGTISLKATGSNVRFILGLYNEESSADFYVNSSDIRYAIIV